MPFFVAAGATAGFGGVAAGWGDGAAAGAVTTGALSRGVGCAEFWAMGVAVGTAVAPQSLQVPVSATTTGVASADADCNCTGVSVGCGAYGTCVQAASAMNSAAGEILIKVWR